MLFYVSFEYNSRYNNAMREKEFTYEYKGISYPVIVTYKRMRSIRYRFKDGKFYISAPIFSLKTDLFKGLDKYAEKLISHDTNKSVPFGNDYIYILGERYELSFPGNLIVEGQFSIKFDDKEQLEKKLKKWFKELVINRVRHYEEMMNLSPYKVRVQKMSTRYGSNSKHTKSLNFATVLMHYDLPIIDSVVVHELAHEVVYNHSADFYKVVYKYCPEYDIYHAKLRKGVFK